MWKLDSAMDSPIGIARPWTPPETEQEPSPRPDYFSDSFSGPDSTYSSFTEHRWPPNRPHEPANTSARCDTPTEGHRSRPKPVTNLTEPAPYTPTKTFSLDNATNAHGAPRYPYTPDSSRILRRSTELPSSPTPWDDYSEDEPSPVQDALSSCIAHFENLIQTRQPDEDQMEYIVGQFEAMASYLSAPNAQSRRTDEHLFLDPEQGLGITSTEALQDAHVGVEAESALLNQAYVAEVGKYIEGVKKYIEDLNMRLDEVKTLNSIQLDVIHDLRGQMKTVQHGVPSSLDMRDEYLEGKSGHDIQSESKVCGLKSCETNANEGPLPSQQDLNEARKHLIIHPAAPSLSPPTHRVITIIRKPHKRSFWASFGEALDAFGDLFLLDY